MSNFEYDYDYYPLIQYFDVQKHFEPSKVLALIFSISAPRSAAVKTSLVTATLLTEYPVLTEQIATLGTARAMTGLVGTWI